VIRIWTRTRTGTGHDCGPCKAKGCWRAINHQQRLIPRACELDDRTDGSRNDRDKERALGVMNGNKLVSVKEAATYLNISPHTLYTMVSQRRIPYAKVGRLVKFDQEVLNTWIKQHTVMPMPYKRA
jgi:excisionase family DNA binding protein